MTACAAKFSRRAISLFENGRTSAGGDVAKQCGVLAQRDHQVGAKACIAGSLSHRTQPLPGLCQHIRRVHVMFAAHQPLMGRVAAEWPTDDLRQFFRVAVCRDCSKILAIVKGQSAVGDPTEGVRIL